MSSAATITIGVKGKTSKTVTVANVLAVLCSISVSEASSVNEGTCATHTLTASVNDGFASQTTKTEL